MRGVGGRWSRSAKVGEFGTGCVKDLQVCLKR